MAKQGRGVPQTVTNEAMPEAPLCCGYKGLMIPAHSGLSHYISMLVGARLYLGRKFCRICPGHTWRVQSLSFAPNFEVSAQITQCLKKFMHVRFLASAVKE